jgi:hypothetical protein
MPVLGRGGKLELRRETPDPTSISFVLADVAVGTLQLAGNTLWPGDQVTIAADRGLPFYGADMVPLCPGGMGMIPGTVLYRHPSWTNNTTFFPSTLPTSFWPSLPIQTTANVYIGVNQLGRASFYSSRAAALNGGSVGRTQLAPVDFDTLTVTPIDNDWLVLCDMQKWTLNTEAASVDQTGLGARFGESVKTLLTGGGDLEFFADRRSRNGAADTTMLLNLLLMVERGCKAEARFWMLCDRQERANSELLPGDLYYQAEILILGTSIQTAAAELITGSARFVTTGTIQLLMGL